jgi:hypothetical protein
MYENYVNFEELLGKTLAEVVEHSHAELAFRTTDGETYRMYHEQDCCEDVSIEDITGDLNDLVGSPITMAEEVVEDGEESDWGTSTWTFYKLATNKGYVTIRWFGESNGYYSESVDFVKEESQ